MAPQSSFIDQFLLKLMIMMSSLAAALNTLGYFLPWVSTKLVSSSPKVHAWYTSTWCPCSFWRSCSPCCMQCYIGCDSAPPRGWNCYGLLGVLGAESSPYTCIHTILKHSTVVSFHLMHNTFIAPTYLKVTLKQVNCVGSPLTQHVEGLQCGTPCAKESCESM